MVEIRFQVETCRLAKKRKEECVVRHRLKSNLELCVGRHIHSRNKVETYPVSVGKWLGLRVSPYTVPLPCTARGGYAIGTAMGICLELTLFMVGRGKGCLYSVPSPPLLCRGGVATQWGYAPHCPLTRETT